MVLPVFETFKHENAFEKCVGASKGNKPARQSTNIRAFSSLSTR
jgi:hypothetical protein